MTCKTAKLIRASANALAFAGITMGAAQAGHAQSLTGDPALPIIVPAPMPQPSFEPDPALGPVPAGPEMALGTADVTPMSGNIDPFYGNIDPFWGNIEPFWGNIDPFTSSTAPLAPAWGNIQPFWQATSTDWKSTSELWNTALATPSNLLAFAPVATALKANLANSEAAWGAAVTARTGKSFADAFTRPLFAQFGIDLDNPLTLAKLSPQKRAQFYLAWYDGLMAYSGQDRVDHWMGTANWTPAITQQQGDGSDTVIGVIDSYLTGEADLLDNVVSATGKTGFAGGHGAGVASLLVASHDGKGLMGIAPKAKVALHNPFDHTGTADWSDIKDGIVSLKSKRASIINASLGEAGVALPSNWNNIFGSGSVAAHKRSTVYVIAAGNEGVTQTADVDWTAAKGTHFLLVGSVDPLGRISTFSNRPGDACLLVNGVCPTTGALADGGKLMNRFITAPGELILVSDGHGGTVRRSGTSFAAPIVAGAIALLHDRWPWLAKDPAASVEIVLRSARDLGAPGVDPIYGVGMIDITASQSPLDFNKLMFYKVEKGVATNLSVAALQTNGVSAAWETSGVGFALFEKVGNSYRDFVVPMSSLLKGKVRTAFGSSEQLQHFLSKRLADFINKSDGGNFTDVVSYTSPDRGGWQMGIASQDPTAYLADRDGDVPHSAFRAVAPGNAVALTAGFGHGAMALAGQHGFGMSTDYDADGGINPMLGLASGGSFLATEVALGARTRVSFGYTERDQRAATDIARTPLERIAGAGEDLTARAMNVRIDHQFAPGRNLAVTYTRLREDNAMLAVQALNGLLEGGSASEALGVSGALEAGHGLTIAATATGGRSAPSGAGQLTAEGNGLVSTAYAVSLTKNGVLRRGDRVRVSFAQPMHIEHGRLTFHSAAITDRATGEIGIVDSVVDVNDGGRVHTGELLYAAPLQNGEGEFSMFGRATFGNPADYRSGFVAGVRVRLAM